MHRLPSLLAAILVLTPVATGAGAEAIPVVLPKAQRAHLGDPRKAMPVVGPQGLVARAILPLGRIRARALLAYNGRGKAFRQSTFTLSAGGASASLTVDALGGGAPLEISFVNRKAGPVEIRLSGGELAPEARSELNALLAKTATLGRPGGLPAPAKGNGTRNQGNLDLLDDILGEKVSDAAQSPLPMVMLAELAVQRVSGAVLVARVETDRITYAPGATGTCTVVIENLAPARSDVKLSLDLVAGIAEARRIATSDLALEAGQTLGQSYLLEVGRAEWGRGLVARASTAEGEDLGTGAFSVVTHPYQVAFHGQGTPMSGSDLWKPDELEAKAEQIARQNVQRYSNIYEAFAWAPCDYSEMTPDDDRPFYSGQTQYAKKRSALQALHRVFHKHGIFCITYGKACASGLPGLEYAHRYPARINVFGPFGFAHESCRVDIIDRMLEGRYRKHGIHEDFWQSWISCWTHFGNLDAENYGCDEIVRSARLLGWDGVRYDGHFTWWQDPPGSAKTVQYCADRIRTQIPGFALGYNYMGTRHHTREGALTDIELAACASGGGTIMSEIYRNLLGDVNVNIRHLQSGGDAVRLHGGYWLAIFDNASIWNEALVMAGGARPMGGGALRKFGTRFSAHIFDPAMRRLQDPSRIIRPVADPGFLWDSFVYQRPIAADRSELVLQLVNVGSQLHFQGSQSQAPAGINPPRRDVVFELSLPQGYAAESVFACDDVSNFQPMAARFDGNRLSIPRVSVWTMVVVNLKKSQAPQSLEQHCDVALKIEGADRSPQPRADRPLSPEELKAARQEKLAVTPALLKTILDATALPNSAPAEKAYQEADFAAHAGVIDRQSWKSAPEPLAVRRDGRLDVHFSRGVFYHRDRMYEALARLKSVHLTDSCFEAGGGELSPNNVLGVKDFPSRRALAGLDVLLLDGIPANALSQQARRDVLDYAEGGGALLIMGGWYSLSKGRYEGSFLEDALPVLCKQSAYLRRLEPKDGLFKPTPDYAALLGAAAPDFGEQQAVEWVNHIRPKPGARVLLTTANGLPLLVCGTCGKGRVAVFAAAHAGAPETPYWEHAAWPTLVAQVLGWLAAGSDQVQPPDPEETARRAAARQALDLGVLEESLTKPDVAREHLQFVLGRGAEEDARLAAAWLLAHPKALAPEQMSDLTELILPHLRSTSAWARLVQPHLAEPPRGLGRLVAEIAAAACPEVKASTVMAWDDLDELTRLRCLAATGDRAVLAQLKQQNRELLAQERALADKLAAAGGGNPEEDGMLPAEGRVKRLYLAWALVRCGQRDEATLDQFCRGVLELPYYAWRQRWLIESAYAGLRDGQPSTAEMRVRMTRVHAVERYARRLDQLVSLWRPVFSPSVIGRDELGRRAAARSLRDCNCQKALPLALAYLEQVESADLPYYAELEHARLDSLRRFYQSLRGCP